MIAMLLSADIKCVVVVVVVVIGEIRNRAL